MKEFTSVDKFDKFVGIINNPEELAGMGITPDEGTGMFQIDRLGELKAFVKKNPKYHIITETTDGDDAGPHGAITYDNEIRIVNRLGYYLGKGSKEPASVCEPIED